MCKHKFTPSRDPQKGYQTTYANFFEHSMSAGTESILDENFELFHGGDSLQKSYGTLLAN